MVVNHIINSFMRFSHQTVVKEGQAGNFNYSTVAEVLENHLKITNHADLLCYSSQSHQFHRTGINLRFMQFYILL